jgi:hypothetical protein
MYYSYSLPTAHQLEEATNTFADLLSKGLSINDSADMMEISHGSGCVLFVAICDRLGMQAR